jgi:hypothetical protein
MRHITLGHFRLYALVVSLVTVVALAGCASKASPDSSGTPSPTGPSPSATSTSPSATTAGGPAQTTTRPPANGSPKMVQVVMTKTGGITGLNLRLLVQPDSTWIVIDGKAGKATPGKFTDAQSSAIAALIADPALKAESQMPPNPGSCADGIAYNFQTLDVQFKYDTCTAAASRPTISKLLKALEDATPL